MHIDFFSAETVETFPRLAAGFESKPPGSLRRIFWEILRLEETKKSGNDGGGFRLDVVNDNDNVRIKICDDVHPLPPISSRFCVEKSVAEKC